MAQAPETDRSEAEQISFELDRLTLTADNRVELTGRWFGVRGRRFVRPTLTLIGSRQRARSLADLEHKPWAAEGGEPWVAIFPLQSPGEEVLELELAVAPDIAVSLSPPPELASLPREPRPSRRAVVAPRNPPPSPEGPAAGAVPVSVAVADPAPVLEPVPQSPSPRAQRSSPERGAAAAVQQNIERLRLRIRTLEEQLEQAAGLDVELRSALLRQEAAERERQNVLRERDEARTGWREAHRGWGESMRERDRVVAERDRAVAERDRFVAERDDVVAELDRVVAERDQAVAELDRIAAEFEQALDDRDRAQTERAPAPGARPGAQPSHRTSVPGRRRAHMGMMWAARVFALLILLAAVAAILIIVSSA